MGIFWQHNKEAAEVGAQVMRPALFRLLFMVFLFASIAAAFWFRFESRMADIQAKTAFWDETGTLSPQDQRTLARHVKLFRDQWGVKVVAHVRSGPLELPEITATTLFLAVAPTRGEALFVAPGLAARALKTESQLQGQDVRLAMEQKLALCAQKGPSIVDCLTQTLDALNTLFQTP